MADVLRLQRLEWLHNRCLKAADEIPGARLIALRSDDELLSNALNGEVQGFPTNLFDFDWEKEHAAALSVIAFFWKLAFEVTPEVSARIDQYFDQHSSAAIDHTGTDPTEKMKRSGFWFPSHESPATGEFSFLSFETDEERQAAVEREASKRNLQKWSIEAFVRQSTGSTVELPPARWGHFSWHKFNGQGWIASQYDRRALPSEATRQQRLIELRLDEIGQDAHDDLKEREWSIDIVLARNNPSVWTYGPVSVCVVEENLFIAYAHALEMLGKPEDVSDPIVPKHSGHEADECDRFVDPLTPRQKKIIRFLWSRKHATQFKTLIDECWKKDVEMTSVSRTLERIGERWYANNLCDISLNISEADQSVKLVKPDKSTDKKTDSTVR